MDLDDSVDGSTLRAIAIKHFDAFISNATIKDLVQRAEILKLKEMQGDCRTIIPNFVSAMGGGLNKLIGLKLYSCATIKCLIDNINPFSSEFSNLVKLKLLDMKNLQKIGYRPPVAGFFEEIEEISLFDCGQLRGTLFVGKWNLRRLKVLQVSHCPMLTSLFTASSAQSLELLEDLMVISCKELKCVIEIEEEGGEIIANDDDKKSYGSMLPNLKDVRISGCEELESMWRVCSKSRSETEVEFTNSRLNHNDLLALKETTIGDSRNTISISPTNYYATCGPMKWFHLEGCPKFILKSILQLDQSSVKELPEIDEKHFIPLERVDVTGSKIEGIFYLEDIPMIGHQPLSSGLKYLWLTDVAEMKYICRGPKHILYFQNLETIIIERCKELEVILSNSVSRSLPQLTRLIIQHCENLKQIVEEENKNVSNFVNLPQTQPCFPRLKQVVVQHCNKLRILFSISTSNEFPELEFLFVNNASQLEKVFEREANLKVEFPKLRFLALANLDSLTDVCQGIPLQNVAYRLVRNCLKLSLDSATTDLSDMPRKWDEDPVLEGDRYMMVDVLKNLKYEDFRDLPPPECEAPFSQDSNLGNLPSSAPDISVDKASEKSLKEAQNQNDGGKVIVSEIAEMETSLAKGPLHETPSHDQMAVGQNEDPQSSDLVQHVRQSEKESSFTGLPISSTLQNLRDSTPIVNQIEVGRTNFHNGKDTEVHLENLQNYVKINEKAQTEVVKEVPPSKIEETATSLIAIPLQNSISQGSEANVHEAIVMSEKAKAAQTSTLSESQSSPLVSLVTSPHEMSAQSVKEAMETSSAQSVLAMDIVSNEIGGGEVIVPEIASVEASSTSSISAKGPLHKTLSHDVRLHAYESSCSGLPIKPTLQSLGDSAPSPGGIMFSQTKTHTNRESEANPINTQDLEEDDLIRLIQIMEEGVDIKVGKPSISVSTTEFAKFEDDLVFEAFTDLEATLKIPLNEIANSEEKSLRLKNALGVLSSHCGEDAESFIGFKATIDSMLQEFQSIISSFKQASATIDKFTELEKKEKSIKEGLPQQKDAAITLISEIRENEKSMTEALRKEADLKEQISRLQAEIEDCEIKLSSLREQKKKRVEETIELVKELESVKKDKSQMVEDQIKAREQLDKVNDNWSSCVDNLRKTTLPLGIYLKQRL